MAEAPADRIVWIDLEMTGLEPDRDRILELAVLVTDGNLEVVAEGPELVLHQPESLLAGMDAWNTEHHTASGLVDRVRASTVTEAEAEAEVLAFLEAHCAPGKCPLAGNSIHQDRRFLRRAMPRIDAFLHYRLIDVSTVKELVKRWLPDVYRHKPAKREAHRALDDIRESLAELAWYRSRAFRAPTPQPGAEG